MSWRNTTTLPAELPRPSSTQRGVLRPADGSGMPAVDRRPPAVGVDAYIERYWFVRWDLARPAERAVLSHPALHLSIEQGAGRLHGFELPSALVHGIVRRTFRVELRGSGWVFGVKFRPGGFAAAFGLDASVFTDRVVALADVVPPADAGRLRDDVLSRSSVAEQAEVMDQWFAARMPDAVPPEYACLLDIVKAMLGDRSLVRAEDVAAEAGVSLRSLQRWFKRSVGVGPKWLLSRYRLHDALNAIDADAPEADDLAALAASLGWFDQAHFTREFTAAVGVSPTAYRRRAKAG